MMAGCNPRITHSEPAGLSRRVSRQNKPAGSFISTLTMLIAVFFSTLLGCGRSDQFALAPVTGRVTVDGSPLAEGTILFRPESGRAGRAKIENGAIVHASTYGIDDGIVLGKHKVAIQPIPEVERAAKAAATGQGTSPSYVQNLSEVRAQAAQIPAKYQDVDQSGLTVEIKDDDNELLLELMSQ